MEFSSEQKARKAALDQVYESSPFGIGGHFLIVILVGFLFVDIIPFNVVLLGVSVQMFILAMRTYSVWRYFKIQTSINKPYEIDRWINYYTIGVSSTGVVWGFSFLFI